MKILQDFGGMKKKVKNKFVWGHVYPLICVCPLLDNSTENPVTRIKNVNLFYIKNSQGPE